MLTRDQLKFTLVQTAITALLCLVVAGIFEWRLRRTETRVTNEANVSRGGKIGSNSETLISYTPRGRRLIPNMRATIARHHLSGSNIEISTNSLGFRDRELSSPKERGEYRILVLGDSITMGDYLPASQVYVERIEAALNSARTGGRVEVINSGITNLGIQEEIAILEESYRQVAPDLVVVAFYLNDSRPPLSFARELAPIGFWRRHSLLIDTVYRRWMLKQWLAEQGADRFAWIAARDSLRWKENREDFLKLAKLARYDWGAAWEPSSWEVIDGGFAQLARLSRAAHFKVAVAAFPVSFQVAADFLDDGPQRKLRELAKDYGFAYFDLLPVLRARRAEQLFFDQCHPTALGNEIIGQALSDFLAPQIAPPTNAASPDAPEQL